MSKLLNCMKERRSYFTGAFVIVALIAAMVAYHQVTEGGPRQTPGEVTIDGR
jgi:hypothetical protein